MKKTVTILTGGLGALAGFYLGSTGVYEACVMIDKIQYPDGVPTGGGLIAVGWLFWYITIPGGTILGYYIGSFFGSKLVGINDKKDL